MNRHPDETATRSRHGIFMATPPIASPLRSNIRDPHGVDALQISSVVDLPAAPADASAASSSGSEADALEPQRRPSLFEGGVQWPTMLGIVAMHLGALAAFIPGTFSWGAVISVPILWWICGGLGICLGYHRLLTHRSFRCSRTMERGLALLGSLSWQGGPLHWVGTHRLHHAEADGELDPHSPQHGFTWSHILWCFYRRPEGRDPRSVVKDLERDPFMRWLDRWFWLPQVALAVVLWGIGWWMTGTQLGALGYVIWGICFRTAFVYHATWFVNSAAHTWGYRNFRTDDGSRNTWWVALFSFGEGWHNNHHAQQRSAAHGMRWWEIDPTWWTVRVLEKLRLVSHVVRPKLDRLDPHR